MKYIRTKDGIYYVSSLRFQNPSKCECEHGLIIKQADTIEELCDEFVIEHQNPYCVEHYLADKNTDLKATNEYIGTIYGAIWTDKGLIYVAKMNDKGELELL